MKESSISLQGAKIEETCKKCKYGLAVGCYNLYCIKFKQKPYEIYYEGKDCPYFSAPKGKVDGDGNNDGK